MSSLQDAWGNFQQGLKSVLRQWTALSLAVENNWGGGDSRRKAYLMEEELITLFRTKKELYRDEVEDFLADFLDDNFSTYAEDGSPGQVAAVLVDMFAQCGRLDYTLANAVRAEEQRNSARAGAAPGTTTSLAVARSTSLPGSHEEDDSSSDEDTGGESSSGAASKMDMDFDGGREAETGAASDGWEMVGSKKHGKGRRR